MGLDAMNRIADDTDHDGRSEEVEWDDEVGANMLAIADPVKAQQRLASYPPGATRTHTV
jgi:hypothetical protein